MGDTKRDLDLKLLGQNIRYRRQGRKWSLDELAERSGVSKPYISDLENGRGGRPNVQYLLRLAVALGTTIDTLVEESAPTPQRRKGEKPKEPLPPGLEQFAKQQNLNVEEVEMLAKLNFRGHRPRDADAWRLIYEAIRIASR